MKSATEELITSIKKNLKQTSINKVDEVKVMESMLNDKDFTIGVYDKGLGYIGQKCPHEEAKNFVSGVIASSTKLDKKDADILSDKYVFTKKDANFLLSNMRDFINVYSGTGRKVNIIQNAKSEANLYTRDVAAGTKIVPDKDNPGKTKEIKTAPFTKIVVQNKSPKYNKGE